MPTNPVTVTGVPEGAQYVIQYKEKDDGDFGYVTNVPTRAGTYVACAVVSDSDKYNGCITDTVEFTIAKKHVNAQVTAETKEYDGDPSTMVTATVTEGLVEGDSIEITGLTGIFCNDDGTVTDSNAGTNKQVRIDTSLAAIEGIGANNYEVTVPDYTTGTIEKSWAFVMADDVVITAGDTVSPEMISSFAYTSVDGDTLSYRLTCDCGEKPDVGDYPIKVELQDQDKAPNCNYNISCIDGLLTVTNAELTVNARGYIGTYDGQPHGITVVTGPNEASAQVYYSKESELTEKNYTQGTTENPTFTDAGEYTVYYCVVAKNYETVSGSKQVVIGKADSSIKSAPTPVTNLVYNGKSQTLIKAGNVEGGTMQYSLDSENWSDDVPTGIEAGPYVVYYRVAGDVNHESSGASTVLSNIDQPIYEYIGGGGLWVKGSTSGLALTFKRYGVSESKDSTFKHFKSASVDGTELKEGEHYTKAEGSLILTLLPEYLETLSLGSHTLTTAFDDGNSSAEFVVAKEGTDGGSNGGSTISNGSSGSTGNGGSVISNGSNGESANGGGTTITNNVGGSGGSISSGGGTITSSGTTASPTAKTGDSSTPIIVVAVIAVIGINAAVIGLRNRKQQD